MSEPTQARICSGGHSREAKEFLSVDQTSLALCQIVNAIDKREISKISLWLKQRLPTKVQFSIAIMKALLSERATVRA